MANDHDWIDWLPELDVAAATSAVSFGTQEHYRYCQINKTSCSIRLVQVFPGRVLGDVRCRLDVCSLAAAPAYTALSYTWGKPDDTYHVLLNGKRHPVRKNLYRFLLQASRRRSWANRLFWIDALCIDQTSVDERLHQVSQMAHIYSRAESVLVWLGPHYENSSLAIRMINKGKLHKYLWQEPVGNAVHLLCRRPYWTRLWVVQELALARSVQFLCGTRMVSWKKLDKFVSAASAAPSYFDRLRYSEEPSFRNSEALRMMEQVRRSRDQTQLYNQVLAFRQLQCSEPRDRVYAILGIAKKGHGSIVPDYRRSLTGLLQDVLREHHKIQPPRTLDSVIQQCQELATLMRLEPNAMMNFSSCRRTLNIPPLDHLQASPVQEDGTLLFPDGLIFMYWWAIAHDHQPVRDLWSRRFGHRCCSPGIASFTRHAIEGNIDDLRQILDRSRRQTCAYSCCGATSHCSEKVVHFVDDLGYRITALLFASKSGHLDIVKLLAGTGGVFVRNDDSLRDALKYLWGNHGAVESCEHCLPYLRNDPRIHATPTYTYSPGWFRFLLEADEVDIGQGPDMLVQNTQKDVPWLRKLIQSIRLEVVGNSLVSYIEDVDAQEHRAYRNVRCEDTDFLMNGEKQSLEGFVSQMSIQDAGRWRDYPACRLKTFAMAMVLTLQQRDVEVHPRDKKWPESAASMLSETTKAAIAGLGLESEEIWPEDLSKTCSTMHDFTSMGE